MERIRAMAWRIGTVGLLLAATVSANRAAADAPSTQPTTRPVSAEEVARLDRGAAVRDVLVEALESSYQHGGEWPATLPPGGAEVVYTPPREADAPAPGRFRVPTVVLHEPLDARPGGVWIGFADGHLEFAPHAPALAECRAQAEVVRAARTDPPATRPAGPLPTGTLALRVVDPDGRPVEGAHVGVFAYDGDAYPDAPPVSLAGDDGPVVVTTDADGAATVAAPQAFAAKFEDRASVPIYVRQVNRDLVATFDVTPADFAPGAPAQEVRLAPGCRVRIEATSVGLRGTGKSITNTLGTAFTPGRERYYTFTAINHGDTIEFLLPPDDWGIKTYSQYTDAAYHYVRVEPGRREIDLRIDLPPDAVTGLTGKPAPELRQIKAWIGGEPTTLAGLRGKVVLLDFWGTWCYPCLESMPDLMKLHDEFAADGLVVIAVHDDRDTTADSVRRELNRIKADPDLGWGGRDLPFRVALDGGGETRIAGTARTTRGATTAAYGISSFPTTVLIAPDGTLVGPVSVGDDGDARERIAVLLDSTERATTRPAATRPDGG